MPDDNKPFIPPKTNTPKLLKIEEPKTPPPEILKGSFTMDDSLLNGGDQTVTIHGKETDNTTKKEEVKVEPKVESKEAVKENESKIVELEQPKEKISSVLKPPADADKKDIKDDKKKEEVINKITVPSKDKVARDYTGFSAEETSVLKGMSNEAFTYATKLIKENKELAKNRDGLFLQHPEAYTLSPEFKQTQFDIRRASIEKQFWATQLEKCKKGEKFNDFGGIDENGNVKMGPEIEPSDAYEEQIRMNVGTCFNAEQQFSQKLQTHQAGFKQKYTQDLQAIQSEREKRFDWVKNPALMEHTVPIEGLGEFSLKQIKADFINLVPPYLRNSPATEVAADLFIALRLQDAIIQELRAGKSSEATKKEEADMIEPNSIVKPKKETESNGSPKEFSLAGMPV